MDTKWFVYHSKAKGVRAATKKLKPSQMRYDEQFIDVIEGVSRKTAVERGRKLVESLTGQQATTAAPAAA